jgi:hypothetical protein
MTQQSNPTGLDLLGRLTNSATRIAEARLIPDADKRGADVEAADNSLKMSWQLIATVVVAILVVAVGLKYAFK